MVWCKSSVLRQSEILYSRQRVIGGVCNGYIVHDVADIIPSGVAVELVRVALRIILLLSELHRISNLGYAIICHVTSEQVGTEIRWPEIPSNIITFRAVQLN